MTPCPQCREAFEELQEEVRQLRDLALGQRFTACLEWKLSPTEGDIVHLLLANDVVTKTHMEAAARARKWDWDAGPKTFEVQICQLRKKLRPFGVVISTHRAIGYYLKPAMREAVKAACEGGGSIVGDPADVVGNAPMTPDILAYLSDHPEGVTRRMVTKHFSDRTSAASTLQALAVKGVVRRWNPDGAGYGFLYYPAKESAA